MYSNIHNKIKDVAVLSCVICIVVSIVIGMGFIAESNEVIGILIVILGSLLGWISSFTLYGFGEMIEHLKTIRDELADIDEDINGLYNTVNK